MSQTRHPWVGGILLACGIIGVLTGAVPCAVNAIRMLFDHDFLSSAGLHSHGVEAMGLSIEWALLSSAMGAYLGVMLLAAGYGWLKGRPWARLATWMYAPAGLVVCLTDLVIFAFHARPGRMRTHMLIADSLALGLAAAVWVGLLARGRRN